MLHVSPTRAIQLRHFTYIELVGPDADRLYYLSLRRGIEEEKVPLSRNRDDATGIYNETLRHDAEGRHFSLHEALNNLYRSPTDGSGYAPYIAVRDVEPRIRLSIAQQGGTIFTTAQLKELCSAMQAGKAYGAVWDPPSATQPSSSGTLRLGKTTAFANDTIRLGSRELQGLIARLQTLIGGLEKGAL